MRARPDNLIELFHIKLQASDPSEPAFPEPLSTAVMSPTVTDEPARLDLARSAAQTGEQRLPASRQRSSPIGLIGSLSLHLLPLLVLLDWSIAPAELVQPIPVQLVIEA